MLIGKSTWITLFRLHFVVPTSNTRDYFWMLSPPSISSLQAASVVSCGCRPFPGRWVQSLSSQLELSSKDDRRPLSRVLKGARSNISRRELR